MFREKGLKEVRKKVKEFVKQQKQPFSVNDVAKVQYFMDNCKSDSLRAST